MLDEMNTLRALCLARGDGDGRHVAYVLEAQTQRASWEMGQCGQVCEITTVGPPAGLLPPPCSPGLAPPAVRPRGHVSGTSLAVGLRPSALRFGPEEHVEDA